MLHSDFGSGPGDGPGALLEGGDAVIVGAVVETLPGKAPEVACRLEALDDLDVVGGDGERRLAIVWASSSAKVLERAMDRLVKGDEDILGIFPTFMGRDDGDEPQEARTQAVNKLLNDE